jgi:hypothetical protein
MEDKGTFKAGRAESVLAIIPQSGIGELRGIVGTGKYSAAQTGCSIELVYDLGL